MIRKIGLIMLVVFIPLYAEEDALTKAMRDELARSMKQLQLENLEKPYFIAYRVIENNGRRTSATFGTLTGGSEFRVRYLNVEVRVGDYKLDNTNFFSLSLGAAGVARMYGGTVQLPLEDDYKELRRQIWLATDGAYKKALEDLSKKRATLQNKTRTEEIPDLTREETSTLAEETPPLTIPASRMEGWVRELSALFKEMPDIFDSRVQLTSSNTQTRYLNSEGGSYTRVRPAVAFIARAATQAPDGMPLEDFVAAYGRSMDDLPSKEQLSARIRELGVHLKALRGANTIEQYNGPVLFEGPAAAELFNQAFAPNLVGTRRPIADNPSYERYAAQADNPFIDKLGARVLPEFLSVSDNATAMEHLKAQLAGWYKVDDDGIAARETKLVEKGTLRSLLTSRNPVRGITRSTGNRRGAGPMPSNLFITADNGLGAQELRERLIGQIKQRGKEYAIIIRSLGNPALRLSRGISMAAMMAGQGGETRVEPAILAYKAYADGKEELVRNVEISGLSAASFKEILAASKEQTVYTAPFRGRSLPLQSYPTFEGPGEGSLVSFVVPSLLFEDMTLKKPSGEIPLPPVAKHPFFDK